MRRRPSIPAPRRATRATRSSVRVTIERLPTLGHDGMERGNAPRRVGRSRIRRNDGSTPRVPRRPVDQPRSLREFQRMFPDEPACVDYMERVRWPDGFVCPKCGAAGTPTRFVEYPEILRCRACKKETSLTSGTIMHGSKQELTVWFWAAYLVSTQTPGMSALQFQRQLGLSRYETAFQLLHKLRAGMIRPDGERDKIGGDWPVEVDEAWVGGRTRKGRGVSDAPLVIAAVEVRERASEKKGRMAVYAGRLRLRHIVSREAAELEPFVSESVEKGTLVRTDGCAGYNALTSMGYRHARLVLDHDPERIKAHLPLIHLVFSNLKTWLRGTHHGVSPQHLQGYLNEYVFRFNRRFYPMTSFASVLGIGSVSRGPTYRGLYDGTYEHRRNDREAAEGVSTGRRRRKRRPRRINRR